MSLRPASRVADLERTLIRRIFDAAPADAINLGLGQPDLPSPPAAVVAGVRAAAGGKTGYTTTAGIEPLRRAIARRYGNGVEAVVTVGSQEAMFAACLCLADPGDEILYPEPGYPAYPTVARLAGATPRAYRLAAETGFRLRAADVLEAVGPRTRLVMLTAPSNPTGACPEPEELRRLLEELRRRDIGWLSDEVYSAFVYDRGFRSALEVDPIGGVVVSGLSKSHSMTGWRVGWAVGAPAIVERITAVHQHLVTCSPSISQWAGLAMLGEEGDRAVARYRDIFAARRTLLGNALRAVPGLPVREPDGAFYYFVDVSEFGGGRTVAERLLAEQNVVTIPGEAFGASASGYLRISFAARDEDLLRGAEALGRVLRRGG